RRSPKTGTLTTTNAGAAAVTIQNIGALSVGTISAASGTVVLGAASAPVGTTIETGIITAANLTGNASGSVTLTGNNLIANLGAFSSGNNNLTLNDTTALNVAGAVNAGTGTVTLTVSGTIGEPSPGAITANLLTGNARGGVSFIGPNKINLLGPFANNVSGLLNFNNVQALTAGGLSSAGGILLTTTSGGLTLNGDLSSPGQSVSLFSAGGIIQTAGAITAGMLTGSSAGATNLPDANLISGLGTFATGGAFTLFNTVTLTQTAGATVNAGSSPILIDNGGAAFNQAGTLTTAGTGTAVTIENTGTLSVGTITVPSGKVVLGTAGGAVGPITETGIITANLLIGNSVGGASLTDANAVNALGPFINAGSGLFAFTDAEALTTSGIVSSAGGISLTTTSGNLTLNADLSSPGQNVGLISAGTITQTGGAIAAGTLSTQSSGGTTLNGENSIGTLAASTNTGSGGFLLNDVAALTISGPVNAGTDNLVITSAGKLSVGGALNAGTDIDLTAPACPWPPPPAPVGMSNLSAPAAT
ncbi:MAG: hypothetical protein JO213_09030, partial [Alphaproteobacteria bacterium]|nr:hypothetical protein [Alphaproteobacteria bacterium]